MRSIFVALFAAVALTAAVPANAGKPLDIRTDVGRGLMTAAPAIGAGAGYWVGQGLAHGGPWQQALVPNAAAVGTATTVGFIGGVAIVVGYDWFRCATGNNFLGAGGPGWNRPIKPTDNVAICRH